MDLKDSLFRVGTNILIYIFQKKSTTITIICQDIGLVSTTTVNYIDIFEDAGLVETYKQGSERIIEITEKGKKIAKKLKILIEAVV